MKTTIRFKSKGKNYEWILNCNLHEYKISIDAAFENWAARIPYDQITIDNFCDYVKSKDINFKCSPYYK
jgi:hypothetical protein